jgi:hypothetical protein
MVALQDLTLEVAEALERLVALHMMEAELTLIVLVVQVVMAFHLQ